MVISDLLINGPDICSLNKLQMAHDINSFPCRFINIIDSLEKYGAESKDKMCMMINRSI